MAVTPEGKVKLAVKRWLKTLPNCWFYMPIQNGMGVTGIPDFVGHLNGKFFAIETKAPKHKDLWAALTPNQQFQVNDIIQKNGLACVVSDVDQAKVYFKSFGLTT